jgi:hypothetical protein
MQTHEIVAAISRLEGIVVATALQEHVEKLPITSPVRARLHSLHRAISDFHIALSLVPKPAKG